MRILASMIDGGFSSAISATNTDASSAIGTARLDTNTTVTTVTAAEPLEITYVNTTTLEGILKASAVKPGSKDTVAQPNEGVVKPDGYKFNLPPHRWSMPVRPKRVDQETVGGDYANYGRKSQSDFDGFRRGRIWYYAGAGDVSTVDSTSGDATRSGGDLSTQRKKFTADHKYAFQFLWNPETISTNVQRNMDITPSNADTLRVVSGVFPGQESVSLSVMLDRTNDFAYAKASGYASPLYYKGRYPNEGPQDFNEQIKKLLAQGTMADLEYLFKAINGAGTGNGEWTTLLGKKTSNVGYLSPTLLAFSLGPDPHDNLSYVGWISNISINHTAFTENMIPLRTTVSFSIECFSGSGISSGA